MSIARPSPDLIPDPNLRAPLIPSESKSPEVKLAVAPTPEEVQSAKVACQKAGAQLVNLGKDKFISTQTLLQKYFTRSSIYARHTEARIDVDLLTINLLKELKEESEKNGALDTFSLWTGTNGLAALITTISLIVHCCNSTITLPMALGCGGLSWFMEKLVYLCCAHKELREKIDKYQEKLNALNDLIKRQEAAQLEHELQVRAGSDRQITAEDFQKIFAAHQEIRKLLKEKEALNRFLIDIEDEINLMKFYFPTVKPATPIMTREEGPPAARIRVPALTIRSLGNDDEQKFTAEIKKLVMENECFGNIDIDKVLRRYNKMFITLGVFVGLLTSIVMTLPIGQVSNVMLLKLALKSLITNYKAYIFGICGGALVGHVGDRVIHVKNLKRHVLPRLNELLQVAVNANQALKTKDAEIHQQGEIIKKLKRD